MTTVSQAPPEPRRVDGSPDLLAASVDVGTLIGSPVFASIAFLATLSQVLGNPLVGTLYGAAWEHPLPQTVVISLAVLACALQASCLLLVPRAAYLAVIGTVTCYLVFTVAVGVPNWTLSMHLVIAAALFGLATRARPVLALGCLAATIAANVLVLTSWFASTGAPVEVISGFAIDQGLAYAVPASGGTALGLLWAAHARRTAEAQQEAARLVRDQDARVTEARDIERARIAQELHDVAAQHVAGLVSLCDASVELAPKQPERALHLLEEVRAEGRFAAASLYGAIGDLRAVDDQATTPTPDLRNIDELVGFWTRRGMIAKLEVLGDVPGLPAVVSTTAYRGVQEALVNAAKHAPGSAVRVSIIAHSDRLEATVSNTAASATRRPEEGIGLGWGLDGLRSKLLLVDGTLHAAATEHGGWQTRIDIPFLDLEGDDPLV